MIFKKVGSVCSVCEGSSVMVISQRDDEDSHLPTPMGQGAVAVLTAEPIILIQRHVAAFLADSRRFPSLHPLSVHTEAQ